MSTPEISSEDENSSGDEFFLAFAHPTSSSQADAISPYHRHILSGMEASIPLPVKLTIRAMDTLQQSYDARQLQGALVELIDLADDDVALQWMEDYHVHVYIVETMECLLSFLDGGELDEGIGCESFGLQCFVRSCTLISKLLSFSPTFRHDIAETKVLQVLMVTLRQFKENSAIQSTGLSTLAYLSTSDEIRVDLLSPEMDVINYAVTRLVSFPDDQKLQIAASFCLRYTIPHAELTEEQSEILYNSLAKSMRLHQANPSVMLEFGKLLLTLVRNGYTPQQILETELHAIVLETMTSSQHGHKITATNIEILAVITSTDEIRTAVAEICHRLGTQLSTILLSALVEDLENTSTNVAVWKLFTSIVDGTIGGEHFYSEQECFRLLSKSLSLHRDSADCQIAGLQLLSRLMDRKPSLHMKVGEERSQEAVHTLCLGAILSHGRDSSDVFVAACNAIYWIAAGNKRLQSLLMEKNTHIAIVDGMKIYLRQSDCVMAGARALRGLWIFSGDGALQSGHQVLGEAMDLLVNALSDYSDKAEVVQEVIAAVACLANIEFVRHQCLLMQVNQRIFYIMLLHADAVLLMETCLEALGILAGAEGAVESMNRSLVLPAVVEAMRNHAKLYAIQKKGLFLVQILIEQFVPDDNSFYLIVAQTINDILTRYMTSIRYRGVIIEACVTMQVMAELCAPSAESLLQSDCHLKLFSILEQWSNDQGLQDVATECLIVLVCDRNLKSDLLVSACKRQLLKMVVCLVELGADVNTGGGTDTPLAVACELMNEELVLFLLEQGIRDIQTPLRRSLERGSHRITGMLLRYLGYDKQAGFVSWSGLNLSSIHPDWFYPTLLQNTLPGGTKTDLAQILVAKFERMRKKRQRRISWCQGDEANPKTRLKLRYSLPNDPSGEVHKGLAASLRVEPNRLKQKPRASFFTARVKTNRHDDDTEFTASGSSLQPHGRYQRVGRSDTLLYSPPLRADFPAEVDRLVYIQWIDEVNEWKRQSVTGSNVPYSPRDPRQGTRGHHVTVDESGNSNWKRKRDSVYGVLSRFDRRESAPSSSHPVYQQTTPPRLHDDRLEDEPVAEDEEERLVDGDEHLGDEDEGIADTSVVSQTTADLDTSRESDDTTDDAVFDQSSALRLANRVRMLDLSSNQIVSISVLTDCRQVHDMFEYLEQLDLGRNKLEKFPEQLFTYLPHLQQLDLHHNHLSEFPLLALSCPKLTRLQLSNNDIVDMTESDVPVSTSLTLLDMSHNQLTSFPMWGQDACPNICHLLLAGNQIHSLPETSIKWKRLETLNLSHNYIKNIPDDFLLGCLALEDLHISGNELDNLPSETVASKLTRLSSVLVSDNHLSCKEPFYVPKFLLALPALRQLDISNNQLQGLAPPSAWKTNCLRELNISNNEITKLNVDSSVSRWTTLERLNLSRNDLEELPREIGKLTALTSLDFSYNVKIHTIPDECGRLTRLFELPLDGLTLHLDETILNGKTKELIGYLHEKLKKSEEHFRIKMMIVGFGGRGKTTLLKSLMKEKRTRDSIATVGILVKDWQYKCLRNGKTVTYTFNTWDFAGQEEFYSTHQCFLSNRSLYLVVYDLSRNASEELEALRPWLLNIQARAPRCPVIVVGTHKDLLSPESKDEVISGMETSIREMCRRPGFPTVADFQTVCATRNNSDVEMLRTHIKTVVDNFKIKGQYVMGQKIPASYVKLEHLIWCRGQEGRDRFPVITQPQLDKIVQDADLDLDADELRQAVRFLHESGVLLHYDDNALQLRYLYFIDPEWLCRMFAQVVTVREINPFITEAGTLRKSDVHLLFTGKKVGKDVSYTFPSSFIPHYLRLLEKFEIALPINDEELLIPCRLPMVRPEISLPKTDRLTRAYEMPYFPIGFWSRLITRLLSFLEDTSRMIIGSNETLNTQSMVYWREGIHVLWSRDAYFLLEGRHKQFSSLVLTVPTSSQGAVLLGHLVDHVDALIDEWYPGLTEKDLDGEQLVKIVVPCVKCESEPPYEFFLDELIDHSKVSDTITCEGHGGSVDLRVLAPDVLLWDFEEKYQIDQSQFKFVQAPEYLLGYGAFGYVYRAQYRQLSVAVKVFSNVGDLSPHKPMRQEATILKRLRHPSLIQMLGVGIQPRVIILELAPLGSLGGLLKNGMNMSRGLQHRVITQTAEGLMYLHKYLIMYRDMKPDNILIFNLSLGVAINAKIADYGVSRFAAPYGFTSTDGTSGFRAPEVSKGETYEFQADVYSMGITAYTIITGGRHPFDDLAFRNMHEDPSASKLRIIDSFASKNCSPWPDMEDVISQSLCQAPELRLSSRRFYEAVRSPELLSLRRAVSVSKQQTVECMVIRRHSSCRIELWIGSGNSEDGQLSWLDLTNPVAEVRGIGFVDRRILCMCVVGEGAILIGCQTGNIWIFDAWDNQCKHHMDTLPGAVLAITHYRGPDDADLIIVGLSSGGLISYDTERLLMDHATPFQTIYKAGDDVPIKCLITNHDKLYASVGTCLIVAKMTDRPITIVSEWNTEEEWNSPGVPNSINCMTLGKSLYLSKRKQTIVEVWSLGRKKKTAAIDIHEKMRSLRPACTASQCAITSMTSQNTALWLGTHGGLTLLMDPLAGTLVTYFHRHVYAVRSLVTVAQSVCTTTVCEQHPENPVEESEFPGCMITGGCGYKNILGAEMGKSDEYGFVTIWNLDLRRQVKDADELDRKRRESMETT